MLYQLILKIYLVALLVVAIFSLETLYLAFRFWQNRKRTLQGETNDYFPRVTIQLPLKLNIHSTFHLMNSFVYPFILILTLLNPSIILIKKQIPEAGIYFIIYAFLLLSFAASFIFYGFSQKSLYKDRIKWKILFPVFISGSMGFSINNTRVIFQGLLRIHTPFMRAPKYRLIGEKESIFGKNYSISLEKMVIIEIMMAIYSCLCLIISLYYYELGIKPFMLMFFSGYSLIGYLSIKHHLSLKHRRT